MNFENGVIAEQNRIISILDEYDIVQLMGGRYSSLQ